MADNILTQDEEIAVARGRYAASVALDLRDHFAASALTGLIHEVVAGGEGIVFRELAEDAYRIADAMLRERAK